MSGLSVGVDVGGTFTDLAAVADDGSVIACKVSSTPSDQSEGVENALRRLPPGAPPVATIVHGTTVVTNMLLERTGARVVLCATDGATDLLELRRQERAALYDLSAQHAPPLVPADRIVKSLEPTTSGDSRSHVTAQAARAVDRARRERAARGARSGCARMGPLTVMAR